MPIVAWYMLSKESYMNRVIRDVFPTAQRNQLQSCLPAKPPPTYHSALRETPICSLISHLVPHALGAITHLNFFKGLLYEPAAACAILSADFVRLMSDWRMSEIVYSRTEWADLTPDLRSVA